MFEKSAICLTCQELLCSSKKRNFCDFSVSKMPKYESTELIKMTQILPVNGDTLLGKPLVIQ